RIRTRTGRPATWTNRLGAPCPLPYLYVRDRLRRRPARRAAERVEDAVAAGTGRAVRPAGGRRAQADRGRQLRQPEARAADGGRRRGDVFVAPRGGRHVRRARAEREGLCPRTRRGRR